MLREVEPAHLLLGRDPQSDQRVDQLQQSPRDRRRIERDEWTPPAQRAAEKNAKGITLAEYGATWIEQRTTNGGEPLAPRTKSHYRRCATGTPTR